MLVQVQYFGTGNRYDFEILNQLAKGSKLKVRKFWGLTPMLVEATDEKLVGWLFCPPPPSSGK